MLNFKIPVYIRKEVEGKADTPLNRQSINRGGMAGFTDQPGVEADPSSNGYNVEVDTEIGKNRRVEVSVPPVKRGRKAKSELSRSYYSTVVGGVPTPTLNKDNDFHEYVVKMSVELLSSNLWQSPYSPYQKQLYDLICQFHDGDGWNFKRISDWLNLHGYQTPRGHIFTHTHAWSIYRKKCRSIQRFARKFPHRITDLKVESADYWEPQPELVAV